MSDHYSIPERGRNETTMLLASDPVVWTKLNAVLDE